MPKTKNKLVQRSNVDKKIMIAVAVLAAAIGFVIFQSHAATNTSSLSSTSLPGGATGILLETLYAHSSGISHTNGKDYYDTYFKNSSGSLINGGKVWQGQAPNGGFTWWGPSHNYSNSGHYWACYALRASGALYGTKPVLYMDVTTYSGHNNLNHYELATGSYMSTYRSYCLRFSGPGTRTEFRMKVKGTDGSKINLGDVKVYYETYSGYGLTRGLQPN